MKLGEKDKRKKNKEDDGKDERRVESDKIEAGKKSEK